MVNFSLLTPEEKKEKNRRQTLKRRGEEDYKKAKNRAKYLKRKEKKDEDARKRANKAKELKRRGNKEFQKKINREKYVKRKSKDDYLAKKKTKDLKRFGTEDYKQKKARYDAHRYESYANRVDEYEKIIRKGHDVMCECCHQLFTEMGVVLASKKRKELLSKLEALEDLANKDIFNLCITCNNTIAHGKVPKQWIGNGLKFPELPEELKDLSPLEQRLVSARIPFMQLRELRPTTQLGIKGNIVNVPVDIDDTVSVLPRAFDKSSVIQLAFKRRLRYKGSYIREWVHPYKVYQAARFLVEQPLYREEGISLSPDFLSRYKQETEEFVVETNENETEDNVVNEDWDETREDDILNPEDEQTLLKEAIPFAPGEGHTPLSILNDDHAEELTFPAIYCGQKRQLKNGVKLSYHDIAKSEIRRADRRCCDPVKLFFMFRKREMLILHNAIQIYLKMTPNQVFTAGQAMDKNFVEALIRNNEAYRFLANDRTSPVYWSWKKRDLMAMIRTLGIPTFFLTLSAAETRWPELIVILVKVLEQRTITEEEADKISWEHKCNLIRKDPVTCARYFDRRTRELFKLLKVKGGAFGEYPIEDYYIRIEFQHRGSPHVHSLLWLEGSPKYDKDCTESKVDCERFIDRFITCRKARSDMEQLYELQHHKHTNTCKRLLQDETVCRFGIPYFPMPETKILEPLEESDLTDEELDKYPSLVKALKEDLSSISKNLKDGINEETFDSFLSRHNICYEKYIRAIRSTLRRAKIFLKRDLSEIRMNAFNEEILRRHRANMDIQFVLDPYACVHYILDYINKSNRGMSRLLREVVDELKVGNMSHRQKLYKIASKFINASEVSSQEAVYILLGMPLSIASRSTIFINTGDKTERVRRFKSEKELKKLMSDSTDVLMNGILEYYIARPDELENICLAEFASKYDKISKIKETDEHDAIDSEDKSGKIYKLKDEKGLIRERKTSKIIRYRRYQKDKELLNFMREKLMLYIPYRDEDIEIFNVDIRSKFEANLPRIIEMEQKFVHDIDTDFYQMENELEKEAREEFFDQVEEAKEYEHLALRRNDMNFDEEICDISEKQQGSFLTPKCIEDNCFISLINSLNEEQLHFVYGVMNHVKTTDEQFLTFLTGGAGVGKSVTITAVYQALIRWYAKHPDFKNIDLPTVLLVAPTGKSAFHIGGTTIHSAFGIPVTQNKSELKPLSADLKNKYRNRLWNLKVIIIDEISMVGAGTLQNVHKRLVEIFECDLPFAGRSVLFVGDLNQLKPVMDNYIFRPPYGFDINVIAGSCLWNLVKYFRLTEIMRQRDDLIFANALNNLASGNLSDDDRNLFESRFFPKTSLLIPMNAIRLYSRNEQVDRYNLRKINEDNGNISYKVDAIDTCNHTDYQVRMKAIASVRHLKTQKTQGLSSNITVKIGIRYMISVNIDVEDGLVNGSSGVLRDIDVIVDGEKSFVNRLWILFDSEDVGSKARSKMPFRCQNGIPLTPITRIQRDIPTKCGSTLLRITRKQFPLVVCEAITIHKSQGQTYEHVVVDTSTTDLQLIYTGFSRAKTASGLFLVGNDLRFPKPRPDKHPISVELARLENEAKWDIPLFRISQLSLREDNLVIGYQNLPYLAKYRQSVSSDHNLSNCDLLCFVETRSEDVPIDGFKSLAVLAPSENSHGINLYSRIPLDYEVIFGGKLDLATKAHVEFLWLFFDIGFNIVVIYISPSSPIQKKLLVIRELLMKLKSTEMPSIIMGDFNIQLQDTDGRKLQQLMIDHGFNISVPIDRPSTDYRTQIDLVFANFNASSTYYESVFSDHKPILTLLNAKYFMKN